MANKGYRIRQPGAFTVAKKRPAFVDGGRAMLLKPVPNIDYSRITEDDILNNQFIRLNTIYTIVDKDGKRQPFKMNAEQYDFFVNQHNLNIILKARQRGFTTIIQLLWLDNALFTPDTSCGVIAHNKEDAQKFFDKKIKLAYDLIPYDFKRKYVPESEQDRAGQLKFANNSYITVGTSLRSDTLQYLHISEFGKLCAKFPERADEVVSGALNTVSVGNNITIESTGEGAHGHFYDLCSEARKLAEVDSELSPMDYKFFFYPWWTAREYRLGMHQEATEDEARYFAELEQQSGVELEPLQRNWYIKKGREQREKMWREYPSTPDESFRGVLSGAPFSRIMANLRARGHITRVPWARAVPVNTFWDLGRNDKMAIWFHQRVGFEDRFIDYHEDNFKALSHYANVLVDGHRKDYVYGEHYLPHDADVVELTRTDGKTRKEVLEELVNGQVWVVPRIEAEIEAINMTREAMGSAVFDAGRCEQGIKCLENVKFRFDDRLQEFQPNLMRTWAKHGADAFCQWGHGYRHNRESSVNRQSSSELARVNRVAQRPKPQSTWRT